MKEVSVGGTAVLLARVGDECFAVGAHCTHYGAPLVDGALVGDRIICPWHHACFDARNGDMHEPPAFDSLANYKVTIDGDEILVDLDGQTADRKEPKMTDADPSVDTRVFAIIGGGAAGYMAAQTLREDGFQGRVVIVTREDRGPYDRPNLSKDYLQGNAEPAWMPLRSDDFFDEHGIEILTDKEVKRVHAGEKKIEFSDGEILDYESVLMATGGVARTLKIPGSDLQNIFNLRSFDSADLIVAAAEKAKNTVIIGASFIGMEAAASIRQRGLPVTVIAPDAVPFEKILGTEIGWMLRKLHEQHGVKFRLGEQVNAFEGDGSVASVILATGERIDADLVIVGIGVRLATPLIDGIDLHKDGGVIADEHLCIGNNIYAAGDITHFPDPRTGESVRIEHWRTALQQGRVAAHNMAGKATAFEAVPFFWTTQYDATLNYVGHAQGWDEIIFQGDVARHDFLAFFIKDRKVLAAAGMNRDRELAFIEELMRTDRMPTADDVRDSSSNVLAEAMGAANLLVTHS